jgi:hypothetical protein
MPVWAVLVRAVPAWAVPAWAEPVWAVPASAAVAWAVLIACVLADGWAGGTDLWADGSRSPWATIPVGAGLPGCRVRSSPAAIRLSLACRSSASSNPNPSRTRTHGMIAAVSSAGRCGIRIAAACTALPAATPPSSRIRQIHAYARLIRPAPRRASTEQPAMTTIPSKISG